MAQTTAAVAMACGQLEISFDCSAYTDISGQSQSMAGTEQTRITGEAYTFAGATAIIKGGKREPMDLTFVIIYTETDAEAYEIIREEFEANDCGDDVCVRWSPRGGDAGEEQITSAAGILTMFKYPDMDATSGAPILGGFTLRVPSLSTAIVAS